MLEKMKAEFEKWHGYPVTDDMDIQTEVAWENWQAAWSAGISAAPVVDELQNLVAALGNLGRIKGDKTLFQHSPATDNECYRAWILLNDAIAEAKSALQAHNAKVSEGE